MPLRHSLWCHAPLMLVAAPLLDGRALMGHIRLGRLPRTIRWRGVIGLLEHAPHDIPAVARATTAAAQQQLRSLVNDPSLTYCYWMLVRLASAARENDFVDALRMLRIDATASDSIIAFVAHVNQNVREEISSNIDSGPFGEIASLALRRALLETVGQHGRSFFGSSVEDLQVTLRSHSSAGQVGELSQRFFGDYLSRTMLYFVERELSNSVGAANALTTVDDSQRFAEALDLYARQTALITRQFAADWYSLHHWESRGQITQSEVQRYVAYALTKLVDELQQADR